MSVFIPVILLSLNLGKSGGIIKPVVTFTPNWGNILQGDHVTLTCKTPSTALEQPQRYYWYKDNQSTPEDQQTFVIESSRKPHSGDYQCKTNISDISDHVTLYVIHEHVILQGPPTAIYEGDPLTLRCHHTTGYVSYSTIFYKDDTEIRSSDTSSTFYIEKVDINTTGTYNCSTQLKHEKQIHEESLHELSTTFEVIVKELFSPLKINATPSRVIEGGDMTVRCDTRLDPLRADTKLQFAFYRDGRTVQEFSVSDTYRVQSAQPEDSGNYTCEVRTTTDTVRKMSDGLHIAVIQAYLPRILPLAIVGSLLVLIIFTVLCLKYSNKWHSCPCPCQKHNQSITITVTDADPDPQDICYVYLDINHLPRGNQVKKDELTVTYATLK